MLLKHVAHAPPALLVAQPKRSLAPDEAARYAGWVTRRAAGEPLAYITGHQAFMGLDLVVDQRVMLVRPSAVRLVEEALESLHSRPPHEEQDLLVADIGASCDAIALALRLFGTMPRCRSPPGWVVRSKSSGSPTASPDPRRTLPSRSVMAGGADAIRPLAALAAGGAPSLKWRTR
jgi:hypothetical protein